MNRRAPAHDPAAMVRVRGARTHNLKGVDVDVPRDALVVFTGVSGSGKSSLAFATLYAEAQRRYLESVSPYARRLFDQLAAPEFDSIDGLPPAIALQQQRGTPTARSSVGSVTTLANLARMLYSRAGDYPRGAPMLYAEAFSANTPEGACPTCQGLGRVYTVTEASMVPEPSKTIRERAVAAWPQAWGGQNLRDILVALHHDVDVPWRDLPKKTRDWILFTDEQPQIAVYAGLTPDETRAAQRAQEEPSYLGTFSSAKRHVMHTYATTESAMMRRRVAQYMIGAPCATCGGKRLTRAALAVTIAGRDITELSRVTLDELAAIMADLASGKRTSPSDRRTKTIKTVPKTRHAENAPVVAPSGEAEAAIVRERIATEMIARLAILRELGLGYLTMERATPTLSPGELQRLRLATQVHSNLFGVVYVLDEPSAGLHPADTEALLGALDRLRGAGNSLFVVEHDLDVIRRADWIVDVGPGAGQHGGEILYSGPHAGLAAVAASQTALHLFPPRAAAPERRARRTPMGWLELAGVTRNNLRGVDARFPLGALTSVTGVSGSGKSSLVTQALVELVRRAFAGDEPAASVDDTEGDDDAPLPPVGGAIVGGADRIARLVEVDQKPIGRTPRSNLATYTGLFTHVRALFAATPAARARRYTAGRFSFNVAAGRCPTCEGEGAVFVEMLFLPSVYAPCSTCHGARYNAKTLEIRYRDHSIADVLALTVDAAAALFDDADPALTRALATVREVGLGYLRLGQPATELSGGEAQRIKLATELQRPTHRGSTLYVLDEPTTGLHPTDVTRLLAQLDRLVAAGNTVIVVEHEMRVVAASDHVIDIGPGAGDAGGTIVAAGTPEQVAISRTSRTAPYLRRAL